MNENETEPRPADAASESSSAERGQSEQPAAAAQPAATPAPAAPQWSAPSATPASVAPASASPASAAPQSGTPWQQQSPWQQPAGYQQHPGYPQQPGYGQQHPGYQQPAGYGQQHPYQQYAQQPAYANGWSAATQTTAQPAVEGQPDWQSTEQTGLPAWAAPVGTDQRPPSSGRGRKIFVAGAAAVLIALGAGGVGAATALAFDNDSNSPTVQTGNSSTTRVVDRSSLAQIASAVQDSVVSITTDSGEGSGVVLTADGYIVTNNHVVATATGSTVTVIFADGKKASATIVGTDPRTDLAVVKATGVSSLKAAKFGKSSDMQVGDTVL
ncbi:S1C family serine protease, partial [Paractinoplanes toevensis]|uniref:S1C family serine protease n=1 Tax=Paractinoplanes toevensis TaxID=571911 RepID=UPI001BB30857